VYTVHNRLTALIVIVRDSTWKNAAGCERPSRLWRLAPSRVAGWTRGRGRVTGDALWQWVVSCGEGASTAL